MRRLALLNPNTNAATTAAMTAIAEAVAPEGVVVEGLTAVFGTPLITEPTALAVAADAVWEMRDSLAAYDAVIVAAFGDPGRARLAEALSAPVIGIAEAAMAAAAQASHGRFAVVTTTPDLAGSIRALAASYGHRDALVGVLTPPGDAASLMAKPAAVEAVLEDLSRKAIETLGVRAIVIGGGPLATAARALAGRLDVPVIEPIPTAVRLAAGS